MNTINPHLEVRTAISSDIPIIQEIAETTWPVAYRGIISKKQIQYMLDHRYGTDAIEKEMFLGDSYLMAEYKGVPVGFACFKYKNDKVYKLDKLYVLPTAQKTGAGRELLKEVIDRIISVGGKEIILQVNRKNNAVSFYEKMGFVTVRQEDFNIGNGYFMNDYVMSLQL